MLKKNIRLNAILSRNKLSSNTLAKSSLGISRKIQDLPIWGYSFYHIFLPISTKKEIDTQYIISFLKERKKNIVLPKIEKNKLNHFLLTKKSKIEKNFWEVLEPINGEQIFPSQIDVVFIPLLAFDKTGNRVGYGKGFYDGFLSECNPETIKIGLSHFEACEKITNIHDGDIRMDYCVTPKQIYTF